MTLKIIAIEGFAVCGISAELTTSQDENFTIIKSLWQNFNYELRLKQVSLGQNWVKYGVTKRIDGQLTYMAAIPFNQPIDGFLIERIEGGKYACFCHTGSLALIKSTIRTIYTHLIPAADVVVDKDRLLIHYEHYDYRFAWDKPDSIIDIMVPIL